MILTIITFVVILSILVFVHEFGHFITAKRLGMGVEEFGFGLPPRLWGKKVGETIYSINWLPVGGFVKLAGEDLEPGQEKEIDPKQRKRFFWARSKKERAAVLLAGVSMNFVLAVVIISFIFTHGVYLPTDQVHVETVSANSPAALAGLQEQDLIISLAGKTVSTTEEFIAITQENLEQPVELKVVRKGEPITVNVTPRKNPPEGEGAMGVAISDIELRKYPWYLAPFYGLKESLYISYLTLVSLGQTLVKLVTFQTSKIDVAGPIGIAEATGQAVKYGYIAVLQLTSLLSLNLAILNALPIPALDGGRLLFVVFEKFLGRKVKPKVEAAAHQIGLMFLLGLIALVTINDIIRILRRG